MDVVLLLFLIISIIGSSARYSLQEREWKVKVGDSQTYSIKKCFDDSDLDGDGDKNNLKLNITDEDGNIVGVTLKKGFALEAEIIALESEISNQTITKLTYNGEIAEKVSNNSFFFNATPFVIKTVDNKSYWEDQAKTYDISVEGDLIVKTEEDTLFGSTIEMRFKWNWKTGWLTYWSFKIYNEEEIGFELELSTGIYIDTTTTPPKITSGWNVLFLLLGFSIIIPLRQRKKKTRRN